MNQTCYGLRSKFNAPFALYCHVRHFVDRLVHAGHGAIFNTITTSTFSATDVLLPPDRILTAFNDRVTPLFQQILVNIRESCTLAALRDSLLPKLLSGELRVSMADVVGNAFNLGPMNVAKYGSPALEGSRTDVTMAEEQEGQHETRDSFQPQETELSGSNVIPFPHIATPKKATDEFVEAVVIARLVKLLAKPDYPLGRFRYNKLAYLAHRKVEDDTTKHYLKKAAGPYSPGRSTVAQRLLRSGTGTSVKPPSTAAKVSCLPRKSRRSNRTRQNTRSAPPLTGLRSFCTIAKTTTWKCLPPWISLPWNLPRLAMP